jgi:hypothetical protein
LAPADWLAHLQQSDGSVGVFAAETEPRWPTGLALLAWRAVDLVHGSQRYSRQVDRAAAWSLADRGKTAPRSPKIGHDTTIVGWSWAADTASWLEPTCFHVLGLTAAGFGDHPRVCEGRRLITDRLLPAGGANYGNTIVLGQQLLAHVAPSGIALTTLGPAAMPDIRIERSLRLLEDAVSPRTTPLSLSWACLGLARHGRLSDHAREWNAGALDDPRWQPLSAYERALLLLAARPSLDWLPGHSIPTSLGATT